MNAERIDPESVAELGVAHRDVARRTFVETELREQPERGREALLAVQTRLRRGIELRRARDMLVSRLEFFGKARSHIKAGRSLLLRGRHVDFRLCGCASERMDMRSHCAVLLVSEALIHSA